MTTGHENMENRLWEYIDGLSAGEEKSIIEQLIANDKAWQLKYHELLDVHQLLQSSDLDAPSMRFTKNVMEKISKYQIAPAAKTYIDKKVIWGIAIFFFTLITAFLVYGLAQADWSSAASTSNGTIDKYVSQNLDKVDYSRFFNNTYITVFMMLNVVLGLMLLDRYLARKRKQFSKEA
jgi:hypothetical protein